MTVLSTAFITDGSISDAKIKLRNNQPLKARNAADSGDVSILKVDASDLVYFVGQPKFTGTAALSDDLVNLGKLNTDLALYIPLTQKGAASGVAPLNGSGLIDSVYLPSSVFEYQGVYNATTNSPVLVNGTGSPGDVYRVTVAGSQDFGAGSLSFAVGDKVVYNSGGTWEKWANGGAVDSVNGQTGVVVLDTDDVAEGANLYYTAARFNTAFSAKSTTDLSEGSNLYYTAARFNSAFAAKSTADLAEVTNLYFTDTRARSAQRYVSETITLSGANITAQNFSLSQSPLAQSVVVAAGGLVQRLTSDYTVSGSTVTLAGDMATYSVANDQIIVTYNY